MYVAVAHTKCEHNRVLIVVLTMVTTPTIIKMRFFQCLYDGCVLSLVRGGCDYIITARSESEAISTPSIIEYKPWRAAKKSS